MFTALLPPGVNSIAVSKHIISCRIILFVGKKRYLLCLTQNVEENNQTMGWGSGTDGRSFMNDFSI